MLYSRKEREKNLCEHHLVASRGISCRGNAWNLEERAVWGRTCARGEQCCTPAHEKEFVPCSKCGAGVCLKDTTFGQNHGFYGGRMQSQGEIAGLFFIVL